MSRWFGSRSSGTAETAQAAGPTARPKGWLDDNEDRLVPPRDLWIGPDDSISHYYRWIWEYLAYLTLLTGLEREQAVLELGCGHGRTARGLLDYIRWPGRYAGLDVHRACIEDAQARIQARFPNFQFTWADIRNRHYNPGGPLTAESYTFPFPDSSFDVVYAASLFTHLLPPETRRYFGETARVLKRAGTPSSARSCSTRIAGRARPFHRTTSSTTRSRVTTAWPCATPGTPTTPSRIARPRCGRTPTRRAWMSSACCPGSGRPVPASR